jgi:hypothetical protein
MNNHLRRFEAKARARDDQGDYWWELRPCDYYAEFEKEKVVWKRVGSVIRFALDIDKKYVLDSCAFMNGHKIRYICAYLNSKLSVYQLLSDSPKTGTGDVIISVQALEPHRVPPITSENQSLVAEIERLVNEILEQKRGNPHADTRDLERKIDELVYRLYDLTPDEIRLIEGK